MKKENLTTPGTVSKILWHFTGGPKWNDEKCRQEDLPKSDAEAYQAFCDILQSRELRLGGYAELVRSVIPQLVQDDSGKLIKGEDVVHTVKSNRVCCLADIPIQHLAYHASRYGQFAIGFYREAVVSHGFNPVLYTHERSQIAADVFFTIGALKSRGVAGVMSVGEKSRPFVGASESGEKSSVERPHGDTHGFEGAVNVAFSSFKNLLAYTKTFKTEEFSTVYCEREWRSTRPFRFCLEDVAMLVLPKQVNMRCYYAEFTENLAQQLCLPRQVPTVPWDTLIEH